MDIPSYDVRCYGNGDSLPDEAETLFARELADSRGPLAQEKHAFVEAVFVHPEYRRGGVATRVMTEAISAARNAGCLHMRCNVKWDNPAGMALYRKCGFALTDISDEGGGEYFVVKPLQVAQ